VETDFAVDSSGFSTCRYVRWFNKKYGREVDNRAWVKCHLMCGVNTKIVTAVDISGWAANDTTYFVPLVQATAEHFGIREVSADKACLSRKHLSVVEAVGGMPFVPFKSNTVDPTGAGAWVRMYHLFMYRREEYMRHYHKRSNIETAFSVDGDCGRGVAQKLLHELGVDVPLEEQRRAGVPQVVESNLRESGTLEGRREGSLAEVGGVNEVVTFAREDEVLVLVTDTVPQLLLRLPRLASLKGALEPALATGDEVEDVALDPVVAAAAVDDVRVPIFRVDRVASITAEDDVPPRAGVKLVLAGFAVDAVGSDAAVEHVVARAGTQLGGAAGAPEDIVAAAGGHVGVR
jgi:hypothetical protein